MRRRKGRGIVISHPVCAPGVWGRRNAAGEKIRGTLANIRCA
ncbi:hypothetical protein HMPREF1546_02653 [Oscillibacter sp. KLE 1745]|nr:hypothetical protein HMPREF1546_02653 [Oscillibacter sp. KLE 1745]